MFALPNLLYLSFFAGRTDFTFSVQTHEVYTVLMPDLRSRFSYHVENDSGECAFGEFVLCPPSTPLHREALTRPMAFYFLRLAWAEPALRAGKHSAGDLARHESNLRIFRQLAGDPLSPASRERAECCLADMFAQTRYELSLPKTRVADPKMERVDAFLRQSFNGHVDINAIAQSVALTPSQLSRRFAECYGVSPRSRLSELRIEHAKRLLLETRWSVEQIAGSCGFEDAFYFSRFFRGKTGQSPRTFRRDRSV